MDRVRLLRRFRSWLMNLQRHASQSFPTQHEDIVHDLAYDFYGRRLATCSADRKIKVWDKSDGGQWEANASFVVCVIPRGVNKMWLTVTQAHSGAIRKLDWAHPEFGQVLASCSFDRQVSVWEEVGSFLALG